MGGTSLGVWFHFRLPEHHLSKESQDTVKLGAGMVATMSAMVLGLLVSSAKGTFDAANLSLAQNGAKIIQIDRLLAEYGPEAMPLRLQLKQALADRVEKIWAGADGKAGGLHAVENSTAVVDFQRLLLSLNPTNDMQKATIVQLRQLSSDIWQNRLLMIEVEQKPVPMVFLALLVFWLTLLFLSFGLFAPRNITVFVVLFICALSVSSAIFLILEMSHPLDGFMKASSAPLVKALEMIGH